MSTAVPNVPPLSIPAAADFTGKRGYAVSINSSGNAALASAAGQKVIGILIDEPAAAGRAAGVATLGRIRCVAGSGGVTAGDLLKTAADGRIVTATTAYTDTSDAGAAQDPLIGSFVIGQALESAAAGAYFDAMINISGAVATTAI